MTLRQVPSFHSICKHIIKKAKKKNIFQFYAKQNYFNNVSDNFILMLVPARVHFLLILNLKNF